MNKWIAGGIALIASLIGFVVGFYAVLIVSFSIGSQGPSIGVALHGIWMAVVQLGVGALLAGILGGIAATRDMRGTLIALAMSFTIAALGIVIILLGSPDFETVLVMGVVMAVANAVLALTDLPGSSPSQSYSR